MCRTAREGTPVGSVPRGVAVTRGELRLGLLYFSTASEVTVTLPVIFAPRIADGNTAPVLRRLIGLCEVLEAHVTDAEQGVDLLNDPGALEEFTEAEARRIRDRYDVTVPRHVAASRALHDYAWSAALLISGPWFLTGELVRLRPEDLRVGMSTATYYVRPPAADPQLAATAGEVREAVAAHMEPVLAAFGPLTRRGSRAMWGMAGDDLVSGLWYLGRTLGREQDGIRAATDVLPGPVGPFPAGAGFRNLRAADGSCHPTRTRAGCCMFYAVRPAEACATCPRTSDAERLRRLG